MTATAFGPQGPNYTTTRPPADPNASAGTDTWFVNCSAAGAKDGTFATAAYFNVTIANLRYLVRTAGVTLADADDTMVYHAVQAMINAAIGAGGGPGIPVTKLNTALTLYVNGSLGSDTLYDGSAATVTGSAGPFATIQKAVNVAQQYAPSTFGVTINVAAGTYAPFINSGFACAAVTIIGAGIGSSFITTATLTFCATWTGGSNSLAISGFSMSSTCTTGNSVLVGSNYGAFVTADNIACNGVNSTSYFFESQGGGLMSVKHATLNGNCGGVISAAGAGSSVDLSFAVFNCISGAYTAFAVAYQLGQVGVSSNGSTCSFTGTPSALTGARYTATFNGIISVNGGGANFFPGNSAGSTSTGGQYA